MVSSGDTWRHSGGGWAGRPRKAERSFASVRPVLSHAVCPCSQLRLPDSMVVLAQLLTWWQALKREGKLPLSEVQDCPFCHFLLVSGKGGPAQIRKEETQIPRLDGAACVYI